MKTEILKIKGGWQEVVDDCRATVGKESLGKEPSRSFKRRILLAEHSPIRDISVKWKVAGHQELGSHPLGPVQHLPRSWWGRRRKGDSVLGLQSKRGSGPTELGNHGQGTGRKGNRGLEPPGRRGG